MPSEFPFPTFKPLLFQVWPSSVLTQRKEVRLHAYLGSNRQDSKVPISKEKSDPVHSSLSTVVYKRHIT